MDRTEILDKAEIFSKERCALMDAGHDWQHIRRVRSMSLHLAKAESADLLTCELAALLHDAFDDKFFSISAEDASSEIAKFLEKLELDEQRIQAVCYVIRHISFKDGKQQAPEITKELACVQDADRLDAIGAIGIARAFSFGGHKNRPMHDPNYDAEMAENSKNGQRIYAPSVQHFYDKLFLLKDRMNTQTARDIATKRHSFMEAFLAQFYAEWDLEKEPQQK